ncbi:hypothetical protein AB5I41_11790 [Sphingomonas sp. MMS24-JH45]
MRLHRIRPLSALGAGRRRKAMIDNFSLGLTHGLLLLTAFILLRRPLLDREPSPHDRKPGAACVTSPSSPSCSRSGAPGSAGRSCSSAPTSTSTSSRRSG